MSDHVDYGAFLSLPPRPIGPRVSALQKLLPIPTPAHHRYEADGNALDTSGTRNGLNAPNFGEGRLGGRSFSLLGGERVDLGAWAPQSEWTVAAWVNPSSIPATGRITIVGGNGENRDWSIAINDGNYVAYYKNGQRLDSGIEATQGVWTHVAATLRGNLLHVFTDGLLRSSVDIGEAYQPSTNGTQIGSDTFNNAGTFTGSFDEISIVERGVSDAEILSLRDNGSIDFIPPKERLLVTFDSPILSTSIDASDVSFSGPTTVGIQAVRAVSDRSIEIVLDNVIDNAGTYTLSVGPQILGSSGIPMDQDQDGIAGEILEDVFSGTFIVDKAGPRIVSQLPNGTTSSVLTSVSVTFNEPINPSSLTPSSIQLTSPSVRAVQAAFAPLTLVGDFIVRAVRAANPFSNLDGAIAVLEDNSLQSEVVTESRPFINYGPQSGNFPNPVNNPLETTADGNHLAFEATSTLVVPAAGPYTFAIGSDDGYRLEVGDFSTQLAGGRAFETDLVTFDFPAAGEYPLKFVFFELTGSSGFELSAAQGKKARFDDDFFLVGDTAVFNDFVPTLGVEATDETNTTFRLYFPPQPIDGDYELRIQPSAQDRSGNIHDQNNNGIGGETGDVYLTTITVDRQPLRIISQSPSGTQQGALESLDVTFNVPIDGGSFSTGDVRIDGPAGRVGVASIDRLSNTTYRINLNRSTADGNYQIVIGPGISDAGGTSMDSDGDAIAGEVEDRYEGTIIVAGAGPFVTDFTPRTISPAPLASVKVKFSEAVDLTNFTPADVVIMGPDGVVPVTGIEFDGALTYTLSFAPQTTSGDYIITLGPNIVDGGGTAMDQDQDGTAGEVVQDVFTRTFRIDSGGPKVLSYTPDFVSRPYAFIDVVFDENIDLATFTPQDVAMIGPNGVVPVTQVVGMDMNKVRISFASQSTVGDYSLIIGPDIFDPSGNPMNQDGDAVFGEPDEDTFTATVTFAAPDLTFDSFTVPTSTKNGDVVRIEWTVQNDGQATAIHPWTDRIVLSQDNVYGNSGDIELGRLIHAAELLEGDSYTGFINAAIPFGIQGDYFILVRTDSSNQVFETSDTNNTDSQPISIGLADPPADLIVDAITVPNTGFIGDNINVTWRVRNDGTATTMATTWVDRVFLSNDSIPGGDILLGNATHNGSLDSNGSYTMTQTFLVPAGVPEGNYFVIVKTDATDRVLEPTAENNNTTSSNASVAISTAPLPDLIATGVALVAGQSPTSGETVIVNWTIANSGDKAATSDWTDAVYLSSDNAFSPDDVRLGESLTSDDLAVGASIDRSLSVRLPDAVSGNFHFIIVPDANNSVNEGAGEDTPPAISDLFEIALFPYADLTVTQVIAPELLVGDPVDLTVSWTVKNVGAGPGRVNAWTDRVILSTDDVLGDADDVVLGTYTHSGVVPAGAEYSRTEIIQLANRTNGRFTLFRANRFGRRGHRVVRRRVECRFARALRRRFADALQRLGRGLGCDHG